MFLAQSEVLFVGHKVSSEGIAPDPEKVRAIVEVTTPQNVADVRRFLGMATYMITFIPHSTNYTKPLCDLLAKQNDCLWGSVQQATFEKIKGPKALDNLAPRIQRFRLRLLRYTYNVVHAQGKILVIAYALSRAPNSQRTLK